LIIVDEKGNENDGDKIQNEEVEEMKLEDPVSVDKT